MGKIKKTITIVVGLAAVLLVICYQSGFFNSARIKPGNTVSLKNAKIADGKNALVLKESIVPEYYSAVGTIHSRTEVELSSRITARVIDVKKRSGDKAKKGEVLIELDKRELAAQRLKAEKYVVEASSGVMAMEQAVKNAEAAYKLSNENYKRDKLLFAKGVIPQKVLDQTVSQRDQAASVLAQAKQRKLQSLALKEVALGAVTEVNAKLGYATITSPFDGIVGKQLVEAGDLASPGIILMTVFDPSRIMFYVPVRETLVTKIKRGDQLKIDVPALGVIVPGEVREIVPSVDPGSRTFLVKICVLKNKGLVPGMFATLKLRIGSKKALIIPSEAVENIGQLEYVTVLLNDETTGKRLVRTSPYEKGKLMVVSGLASGDTILLNESL